MKVVGPAQEMPWEFCSRVTYTPFGRRELQPANQSGSRNILPFSQFPFPPNLQQTSQFAGPREIGKVQGKGFLNPETPHSAQAAPELRKAEADLGDSIFIPPTTPSHLCLALLGFGQAGPFIGNKFFKGHSTLHRMETIIFALECGLEAFIYLYFSN